MSCKLGCMVLALTVAAVWPGAALAIDDSAKGAARELANEAKRDLDAGRFADAGQKFRQAYEIAKVPTLAVWAARALARCGQLVAATELYRQAAHLVPNDLWLGNVQQQAQADAEKELGEIQPRIPRLRIRVEGAAATDVEVTIDEVRITSAMLGVEIPKDAGRRHIVGKQGGETVEQTIDLGEGEHKQAVLRFKAAQAETPPARETDKARVVREERRDELITSKVVPAEAQPAGSRGGAQRTWGWVSVGVGAAGLLTGAVTGIVVLSDSGLRGNCPNGVCNPAKVDSGSLSTYNSLRNVSTVGFIVGGVGAAVGVTLLLWTPKYESEPRMALWLGPASAGVKGAF
jgi:tetratricopeptide (TPR) repeat protein